ncbi:hypothetical protein [Pseudomonas shirazensis]
MKKRKIIYRSSFLLPNNNFIVGLGSVLNIAGNYFDYDVSKTENEADLKALHSDWQNVGNDIKKSKEKFEKDNKDKLCLNF